MRICTLSLSLCLFAALSACTMIKNETTEYAATAATAGYPFVYADTTGNTYLRELRQAYGLEAYLADATSDRQRALLLVDWSRRQWKGHGSKVPTAGDALTILEEAQQGRKFRCVEYATVASAAMASVGLPSRRVGLKKKTVETSIGGGGHMVTEVWLPDEEKWALLDGEYNLMPVVDGRALNAVELQEALQTEQAVSFVSAAGPVMKARQKRYLGFIERYLYYINARFDERKLPEPYERITFEGKTQLMLVPKGAAEPRRFQRKQVMDKFIYTHSREDFYAPPRIASR